MELQFLCCGLSSPWSKSIYLATRRQFLDPEYLYLCSLSLSHKQNPLLSLAPSLIPRPLPDFLHSCEIKSMSGLGTRLTHSLSLYFYLSLSPSLPPSPSLRCPSSVSVRVCSPQWSTPTQYRTKDNESVNVINRCSCTAWSWPSWRLSLGYITISRLPSVSFVQLLLACVDHSLDFSSSITDFIYSPHNTQEIIFYMVVVSMSCTVSLRTHPCTSLICVTLLLSYTATKYLQYRCHNVLILLTYTSVPMTSSTLGSLFLHVPFQP